MCCLLFCLFACFFVYFFACLPNVFWSNGFFFVCAWWLICFGPPGSQTIWNSSRWNGSCSASSFTLHCANIWVHQRFVASVFAAKGICFPKENGWGVLCVIRFSKVLQLGVAAGGVPIFAHPHRHVNGRCAWPTSIPSLHVCSWRWCCRRRQQRRVCWRSCQNLLLVAHSWLEGVCMLFLNRFVCLLVGWFVGWFVCLSVRSLVCFLLFAWLVVCLFACFVGSFFLSMFCCLHGCLVVWLFLCFFLSFSLYC